MGIEFVARILAIEMSIQQTNMMHIINCLKEYKWFQLNKPDGRK